MTGAVRHHPVRSPDDILRGRDIICFSHDWGGDPYARTHLMRLLARTTAVRTVGIENRVQASQPTAPSATTTRPSRARRTRARAGRASRSMRSSLSSSERSVVIEPVCHRAATRPSAAAWCAGIVRAQPSQAGYVWGDRRSASRPAQSCLVMRGHMRSPPAWSARRMAASSAASTRPPSTTRRPPT